MFLINDADGDRDAIAIEDAHDDSPKDIDPGEVLDEDAPVPIGRGAEATEDAPGGGSDVVLGTEEVTGEPVLLPYTRRPEHLTIVGGLGPGRPRCWNGWSARTSSMAPPA